MRRSTFVVSDELLEQLRRAAAERGVSMAELIREALQDKVNICRPRPRSLGIGASGHADTARRAGEERPEPHAWR